MLLQVNNDFTNAPQCYIIRALPVLSTLFTYTEPTIYPSIQTYGYIIKDINNYGFDYATSHHRAMGKQIRSDDINCKM